MVKSLKHSKHIGSVENSFTIFGFERSGVHYSSTTVVVVAAAAATTIYGDNDVIPLLAACLGYWG